MVGVSTKYKSLQLEASNNCASRPILGRVTTVLVVDDERAQRELLWRWLDRWGYSVFTAADAATALAMMAAHPADIMVTGMRMPEHDGLWLIERVSANWPRTAIIMASGVVEIEAMQKAQRLGAVDYVTKPFGKELLHQALERAEKKLA